MPLQEKYRGPKAPDLMPNEIPTRGIPPSDAPMLFTGDDSAAAERLMAAMRARQLPITDAVGGVLPSCLCVAWLAGCCLALQAARVLPPASIWMQG